MSDPEQEIVTPGEMAHLERAHHEICTALTVLRSNTELVRMEIRLQADGSTVLAVQAHLTELDAAVDRLHRLAAQMRSWHDGPPSATGGKPEGARRTRILP